MNEELKTALTARLLAMADDELILGHRDSEWTGHAPILEEDIAFANIAQDEIGHAIIWYDLYSELTGEDPDQLAFLRDAVDFRNVQLVELENGDWAFSMLRQYLFDTAEMILLAELVSSHYRPLADAAAKMRQEELYHYRHTSSWIRRLGLGTEESNHRTQNALDALWPYALQLFVPLPEDRLLVGASFVPDPVHVGQEWQEQVTSFLEEVELQVPSAGVPKATDRAQHTEFLVSLLSDMQLVVRTDPQAKW
jgi:ring-1,2-phenylacetyl-CoA epoxidase subunit PaaC